MNAAESLKQFGTVAFGIGIMLEHIRVDDASPGAIECGVWMSLVPDLYRLDVIDSLRASFERFKNCKLNQETLYVFIHDLHDQILRSVRPR